MNYFIKEKISDIIKFLKENKISYEINNSAMIEISEKTPKQTRLKILSKCNELKISLYYGKPKNRDS